MSYVTTSPLQPTQLGWATSEYLAVLMGLAVVWQGAQALLALLREHHREFSWALMIPF